MAGRDTPAGRRAYNAYMRVYMRKRYRRLKLEAAHARGRKRRWSTEEIEWLHHDYPNQDTRSLALAMGRSYHTLWAKAGELGIQKTREHEERMRVAAAERSRELQDKGVLPRYPKGHVPANKGKKMPRGWAPGRMATTQFKKGLRIYHQMDIGATRLVDGYVYVKVAEVPCVPYTVNWKPLHVLNWERANGRPLPAGHCLVFRDRNRENVELDNLELITRADNMKRNSVHNLPKPLVEIVQLRGAIVRQINRRERNANHRGFESSPVRDASGPAQQREADGHRSRQGGRRRREGDRG